MAIKIDGRRIADGILADLKKKESFGKYLALLMSSEEKSAMQFLKQQEKFAKILDIPTFICWRLEEIEFICGLEAVGGVNVNLPLPSDCNRDLILEMIDPIKDINCLNGRWNDFVLPPSVLAFKKILESLNYELLEKKVVVVGAGFLIGGPIIGYLKNRVKDLKIFRSKNNLNDPAESKALGEADLVISGTGKRNLLNPAMFKAGAGVIDFGNGDLDIGECDTLERLAFYTPPIGGTGPILTACLFENFYKLTELQA